MHKLLVATFYLVILASPVHAGYDPGAPQPHPADLLVSTTPTLEGYSIKEYKGIVRGVTVRQPTIGQGLSASLQRLKGGHISAYVAMCDTARQQAYDICLDRARALGANAIVGMAYDSSGFEHGDNVATEVICYGTAVTVEKEDKVSSADQVKISASNRDVENADADADKSMKAPAENGNTTAPK